MKQIKQGAMLWRYLLLLLATALRFYRLGYQSLWSDEGNSISLARAGFSEIAGRTAFDIHPPFYYWVLKSWLILFGDTEFAVRSLSAVLGILLVGLIYHLGRRLFGEAVGLAAMAVASVAPFQIYYAQETRMYMLLALLGALCIALAIALWQPSHLATRVDRLLSGGGYLIAVTMGLYTQYAFPIIWLVINLVALFVLWPRKGHLWTWIGLQIIPLLAYLPWMPVAFRQITTWPSLVERATAAKIGLTLIEHISLGPPATRVPQGWLVIFGGMALLGLLTGLRQWKKYPRQRCALALTGLWVLLPAGLTGLLFRPAYLKIFLMASPAFCLLIGLGIVNLGRSQRAATGWPALLGYLAMVLVAYPSLLALEAYYQDPAFQRDNYRGIAAFIKAVGTPEDIVIVHAPGQQEVFGYYYRPGPGQATMVPLPRERPLDPQAVLAELETLAAQANRIYGVYWATEEADPEGLIEDWLNKHTFKASDIWFGNVRLVSYAASTVALMPRKTDFRFGDHISLQGVGLSSDRIAPGEILQIQLVWETDSPLANIYTVFVQLLDQANHLVGQRDTQPLIPTTAWSPQAPIRDKHGLYLEPGTPPGEHSLIAGLYDSTTGKRLLGADGKDFVTLDVISVVKNRSPLPPEAFQIQHIINSPPLLGYDLYKSGYASDPEAPLHTGDPLHVNLYWQRPASLPADEHLVLRLVNQKQQPQQIVAQWQRPAAGVNYPFAEWAIDEIVRGQFDLFLSQAPPATYHLEILLGGTVVGKTNPFEVIEVTP